MVFRKEVRVAVTLAVLLIYYSIVKYVAANQAYQTIFDMIFWFFIALFAYSQVTARPHGKLRHREFYMLWMFICASLYMLSYFVSGLFDGFGFTMYDISFAGIIRNTVTLGSVIIFKEWVRFTLINSVQKKFSLLFSIAIVFVFSFIEINLIALFQIKGLEDITTFIASNILPIIFFNAFMTYASYIAGFRATTIYACITKFPLWLLPILPNFKWITLLLLGTSFPIISMIVLRTVSKGKSIRGRRRNHQENSPYSLLLVSLLVVALVWFSLGIFPTYPTVIASNSMNPYITKGDMVLLAKKDFDDIQIGDVIAYRLEDINIVHRVVGMKFSDGDNQLITKGDANNSNDSLQVVRGQYRGSVTFVIPYLGLPSLLLKSPRNQSLVDTGEDAP